VTVTERKMRELKAMADATYEAVVSVEMAARGRQAKRLEAKATSGHR
jgi:hypothetical protein